jgi:Phasin protein
LATTATKNVEKMGETTQEMARSAQRAGQIWSGYLTEVQEINTEFARRATESWIEAFRKQTELNQRMAQRLYSESDGQSDAWQGLAQDWMKAAPAPFYNPFGFFRRGVETAARSAEQVTDVTKQATAASIANTNGGVPIAGYDDLNVAEVSERIDGLNAEQLKTVREYEKRNKNRETVIEEIDRKIKAATS